MIRKFSLSAGMVTLALVFAAGITAGAMAQTQSGQPQSASSKVSDNKPGGASTSHQSEVKNISDNKPGGASKIQPPISDHPSANKPGG
jgi:hypothetical protein